MTRFNSEDMIKCILGLKTHRHIVKQEKLEYGTFFEILTRLIFRGGSAAPFRGSRQDVGSSRGLPTSHSVR